MTGYESQLSPEYIRQCFSVGTDGVLRWKERDRSHFKNQCSYTYIKNLAGKPAGTKDGKGYIGVFMRRDGKVYRLLAHRIVWCLHTGSWPEQHIDHINRIRDDNRIENLRDVSPEVNLKNNGKTGGSGLTGAFPRRGRFIAKFQAGGRERFLGTFYTAEEAHAAYLAARAEHEQTRAEA